MKRVTRFTINSNRQHAGYSNAALSTKHLTIMQDLFDRVNQETQKLAKLYSSFAVKLPSLSQKEKEELWQEMQNLAEKIKELRLKLSL